MDTKIISVLLNLNPKYLHKDIIKTHIEDLLNKNVLNYSFNDLGKVLRINKIISIGIGKIHVDTGFSKTPVTFEADIFLPKVDQIVKGVIEKYDTNGGVYVNYDNIISIFCLNSNLNSLFNFNKTKNKKENDIEKDELENKNLNDNIGMEISVKITKVNFNEQSMIVIGKII
jgi:DNA-directed RNA polymerase subunit E'/Rpb7